MHGPEIFDPTWTPPEGMLPHQLASVERMRRTYFALKRQYAEAVAAKRERQWVATAAWANANAQSGWPD